MRKDFRALPAAATTELIALFEAGNWARLVAAGNRVATRYPRHPLGWKASGKALLQMGKMPEALELLSRVIKLAPDDFDGYNDLGTALHAVGRTNEAAKALRRAVALNPRSSEALSNLGRTLLASGKYEEAVSCCRQSVEINPGSAIGYNNLGSVLRETRRLAEAEAAFRHSLTLKPYYLEALVNLGNTLDDLGRWSEAIENLQLATRLYPESGVAHNVLGRALSRLGGNDEEAERALEHAIALDAYDNSTYVELGNILVRRKQIHAALIMFRRAQELQPLITWRANREKPAFSAVFLDTPLAGSTPVSYLAGRAEYECHFHCVIPDEPVDFDLLRSKADIVFNMICNADDGQDILVHALAIVERLDRPTINHPRLIMNTDRETIARRLADIPDCVIPATIRIAGSALQEAASNKELAGMQMPLLVRVAGTHGGDDFDKCDGWEDVAGFVSRNIATTYYAIRYVEYASDDGLYRKYRIIFIDGEIFPYHLAIHDDWKVHHFRTDMANHAWMREEEERFLADMGTVFNAAHQVALRAIAKATELDYGGIDCGIDRDGRILVFEANASMRVHDETTECFLYKNQYVAKIKNAFDAALSRRRIGG